MKRARLKTIMSYEMDFIDGMSRERINSIFDELENTHKDIKMEISLDWGGCYYAGDTPDIQIDFTGESK